MGVQELRQAYLELMMDEPGSSLEAFLRRVATGDYGPQRGDEIEAFLHEVERDILGSIQTRAATNPRFGEIAEERAEETRENIAGLIRRFAAPPPDPR